MIRYENKGRFWEIAVVGTAVITRHGKVGGDGKATTKELASAEAALKERDKRVRATEKKGYERVLFGAEQPQPASSELERAIADDPSPEAFLVYADWLQARGDPRGELGALQHALELKPDQPKLVRAAARLLSEGGAYLLPPRLAEALRKRRGKDKPETGYCELRWRGGFVYGARIGRSSPKPPYTVRELTAMLLAHPSGRLLCELEIGALGEKEAPDYQGVVEALTAAAPRALHQLVLARFAPEEQELAATSLGEVGALGEAMPRLRQLTLRGELGLEGAAFPRLAELELESTGLDRPLRQLAAADLPRLETLRLGCARSALDPKAARAAFDALARGPLCRLAVRDCDNTVELVDALLGSPLAPRLLDLDLGGGSLTDNQARRLTGAALARLERLVVEGNHLTDQSRTALADLEVELDFGTQRPRPVAGLTEGKVRAFAGNPRTMGSARGLADPARWNRVGLDRGALWGEYTGSDAYEVFVRVEGTDGACTCPSFNYPCKHVVALLLMAAHCKPIPEAPAPPGLEQRCREQRYASSWE